MSAYDHWSHTGDAVAARALDAEREEELRAARRLAEVTAACDRGAHGYCFGIVKYSSYGPAHACHCRCHPIQLA